MNKYNISFNDAGWDYPSQWFTNNVTLYDVDDNITTIYSEAIKYSIPDGITILAPGAFDSCNSLLSVTIPNEVTIIDSTAFATCPLLTSVTIPEGVTTIGSYAFYYCPQLSVINIPDTITTISERAFAGCSALTEITLPVIDYPKTILYDNTSLIVIYANPIEDGDALKAKLEVTNSEYASLVLLQANIVELKDRNNKTTYPITSTDAVYDNNSVTVSVKMDEINDRLTTLEEMPSSGPEMPDTWDYSVVRKKAYVNLFEQEYNTYTFLNVKDFSGNLNTYSEKPTYFVNGLSNQINAIKFKANAVGTIDFGTTMYPYYDVQGMPSFVLSSLANFDEHLFTLTISADDVGKEITIVVSHDDPRITNLNMDYYANNIITMEAGRTFGYKCSSSNILTSDGVHLEWTYGGARYSIDSSNELMEIFDTTSLNVRYRILGYTCDGLNNMVDRILELERKIVLLENK